MFILWPRIGGSMQKPKYSAVVLHRILTSDKKSLYAPAFLSSPSKLPHIVAYFSIFFSSKNASMCETFFFFLLCLYWIEVKKRGRWWQVLCMKYHFFLSFLQCLHVFKQFAERLLHGQHACLNTSNKFFLFFSVLVDFHQVKQLGQKVLSITLTNLANFASWWNTEDTSCKKLISFSS